MALTPRDLLERWEERAGDGLPIRRPTAERVLAMLGGAAPATPIPAPMPRLEPITLGDVAACAVMAGCRPGVLPLLVAALRGIAEPEFNSLGVVTTTGNAAVGMVVSGPAAMEANISSGPNCLGPTVAENGPIGRALAICLRLLVGAVPGELDVATLGQPAKFGLCFAEGSLPQGWADLDGAPSAVTVFSCAGLVEVANLSAKHGDELVDSMRVALAPFAFGSPLFVVPPEWAAMLARDGWERERITRHLVDNVTLTGCLLVVAGGIGGKAALVLPWRGGSAPVTVPV